MAEDDTKKETSGDTKQTDAANSNNGVPAYDEITPQQFLALTMEQKKILAVELSKHQTAHMRAMIISWALSPGSKVVLAHKDGIYESPVEALKQCMQDASHISPFADTFVPFMHFLNEAIKKFNEESKREPNLRLLVILDDVKVTNYVAPNGKLSTNRKMNCCGVSPGVLDDYKKDPAGTRARMAAMPAIKINKMS
jgi:hypothetical protein